jgi:hypothetical protein
MKTRKEIPVKEVEIGKNYYFNVGLSVDSFKKVKAVSERKSNTGERIVRFYCPVYEDKQYGKSVYQELFDFNTIYK